MSQITVLRSKLHQCTVTNANLNYVGSITIDEALMQAVNICRFEKVQIVNITNGERFETYVIPGPLHSGAIELNGGGARRAQVGDILIIFTYAQVTPEELETWTPKVAFIGEGNQLLEVRNYPDLFSPEPLKV